MFPRSMLARIRERGWIEVARRAAWWSLSTAGRVLLRLAEPFAPDHSLPVSREDREALSGNQRLLGVHGRRRCFVIGRGPSVQTEDLSRLSGEVTLVMNGFEHPDLARWKPTYHCVSDPFYFDSEASLDLLKAQVEKCRAEILVVPLRFRQQIEQSGRFDGMTIHFAHFQGELKEEPIRELDMAGPLPGVWCVSELAIMVALYTGCSPVYLLGLDHDWLARPAHNQGWEAYPYRSILEFELKIWKGYEHLKAFADSRGIPIRNATRGSFLDVFPQVTYESLFGSGSAASPTRVAESRSLGTSTIEPGGEPAR
jgi:hypothetical protein